MIDPPPLPRRFLDVSRVVAVGSALWLVGAAVLFAAWLTTGRPLDIWFTTCLAGAGLGAIGWGIFRWQRAAARRGSRTAQTGLEWSADAGPPGAGHAPPRDGQHHPGPS